MRGPVRSPDDEPADGEALRRLLDAARRAEGAGAAAAWLDLVDALHPRIAAMVQLQGASIGLERGAHDAVAQEVHLAVWALVRQPGGRTGGQVRLALPALVRRAAADALRRQVRGTDAAQEAEIAAAWTAHAEVVDDADAHVLVAAALEQMDDRRRRRVLERDLAGLPGEATALALAMTMATVRSHRLDANAELRALRRDWS